MRRQCRQGLRVHQGKVCEETVQTRTESAPGEGVCKEEETVQARAESAPGEGVYEEEETVQTRAESAPGEGV